MPLANGRPRRRSFAPGGPPPPGQELPLPAAPAQPLSIQAALAMQAGRPAKARALLLQEAGLPPETPPAGGRTVPPRPPTVPPLPPPVSQPPNGGRTVPPRAPGGLGFYDKWLRAMQRRTGRGPTRATTSALRGVFF